MRIKQSIPATYRYTRVGKWFKTHLFEVADNHFETLHFNYNATTYLRETGLRLLLANFLLNGGLSGRPAARSKTVTPGSRIKLVFGLRVCFPTRSRGRGGGSAAVSAPALESVAAPETGRLRGGRRGGRGGGRGGGGCGGRGRGGGVFGCRSFCC